MGAASTGAESLECCNNQEEGSVRNNLNQNHQPNRAQHQPAPPVAPVPLASSENNPPLPLVLISSLNHQPPPTTLLQSPPLQPLHLNNINQQQQAQRNNHLHYTLDIENNNQSNHLYVNPQGNFNYDYYLQTFFDEHDYYNQLNNNHAHNYAGTVSIYSEAETPMTVAASNLSASCQCLFLRYCKHKKRASSSCCQRPQPKLDGSKQKKSAPSKEPEKKPKPSGAAAPRGRGATGRGMDTNDADPLMRRPRRRKENSEQDLASKQQQQQQQQPQQQGSTAFDQKQQQAKFQRCNPLCAERVSITNCHQLPP
ncbi:probable serine/threonine-protein kinase MARK-A isoform X2 [Armigeres subalbatus]|uniref:probable serine/threonine-protein kinase MARK-A isoform X2 n=1 Tax=Armigeres subalbatus TaxID=124917 RepID=UPI002ED1BFF6